MGKTSGVLRTGAFAFVLGTGVMLAGCDAGRERAATTARPATGDSAPAATVAATPAAPAAPVAPSTPARASIGNGGVKASAGDVSVELPN